jgi:cytochrome c-type biogenesis protein
MEVQVSFALAFFAGVVSFLSPCVLPVVPSYLTFISGFTLEELQEGSVKGARRSAALHALSFGFGFGAVFMTLGLAATAFGRSLNQWLPLVSRGGGVIVLVFGLYLLGVLRVPSLAREWRLHLSSKPAGLLGSFLVGVAFGAGWTPCIGPILGTILLYAGLEGTVVQGMGLLAVYGAGLGLPFVLAAVGFNWFLAGFERMRRWAGPLEKVAGVLLVVVGFLMLTGQFAALSATLADMGQLINLEL